MYFELILNYVFFFKRNPKFLFVGHFITFFQRQFLRQAWYQISDTEMVLLKDYQCKNYQQKAHESGQGEGAKINKNMGLGFTKFHC